MYKIIISVFFSLLILAIIGPIAMSLEGNDQIIKGHCIGKVCIGDNLKTIKAKYTDCVVKINDSKTGFYIFDNEGNFLIEFSNKKSVDNSNAPIRYIMTSNPNFCFIPGEIYLETRISELIKKYGKPAYESGPNGYSVSFPGWPVKTSFVHDRYKVNTLVGVFNPKLSEMFKISGTMNEEAEKNMLKKYPDKTIINSFEIFSDNYTDGKAME